MNSPAGVVAPDRGGGVIHPGLGVEGVAGGVRCVVEASPPRKKVGFWRRCFGAAASGSLCAGCKYISPMWAGF